MKKLLILVGSICLILVLAALLLPACAAPAAPAAPAPAKVTTWTMTSYLDVGSAQYIIPTRIAERIETMSGGRLEVELFPGGAIVPATDEFEAVHKGTIDCAFTGAGFAIGTLGIIGNLFHQRVGGLTGVQFMLWYLTGGGDELAKRMYEPFNLVYVNTCCVEVPEVWAHSTKPINSLADLEGLKMRGMGDGAEVLARLGVAMVFIPPPEIYEAMARGVIDACECSNLMVHWTMAFHEVAEYMYLSPSRAPSASACILANKDVWAKLAPDLRKIVEEAAGREVMTYLADCVVGCAEALEKYKAYGTKIFPVPEEIDQAIYRVAAEFYAEKAVTESPLYAEVLASQEAFKKLCDDQDIR